MLHDHRAKPLEFLGLLLAMDIGVLDRDGLGSRDIAIDVWDRQTPFLGRLEGFGPLGDSRVDHNFRIDELLVAVLLFFSLGDGDHAERVIDLRSSESNPVIDGQQIQHILGEFADLGRDGFDGFRFCAQDRVGLAVLEVIFLIEAHGVRDEGKDETYHRIFHLQINGKYLGWSGASRNKQLERWQSGLMQPS